MKRLEFIPFYKICPPNYRLDFGLHVDFNKLEYLIVPCSSLLTMINRSDDNYNLQSLNVYWCDDTNNTIEFFESLHRFLKLQILSVDDMELFPKVISLNGKFALEKLKKLSLSKITIENLIHFLSKCQIFQLENLQIELNEQNKQSGYHWKLLKFFKTIFTASNQSPLNESLEKLTTLEIKCKRLPENISELFSKMLNVENLFIELTDIYGGKIPSSLSIQSLPSKGGNMSIELLDICYSLVISIKNLKYIQINHNGSYRNDIVLLKRSLSHFYETMPERYPKKIEINHQRLPFKLLESDKELHAFVTRNSDEIGSYLYSKLNRKRHVK